MPELFQFDDYQKCMDLSTDSISPAYCIVNTLIKPDESSELSRLIKEFSKREKQHFRHDKLQRGICLENCLRLAERLSDVESFYVEKFPSDTKLNFDFVNYPFVKEDRSKFNRVVNVCINKQLVNYNLTGFSSIEYCLRHEQRIPTGLNELNCRLNWINYHFQSADWLDYAVICVIVVWLAAVIVSSVYDKCGTSKQHHYREPHERSCKLITKMRHDFCRSFSFHS